MKVILTSVLIAWSLSMIVSCGKTSAIPPHGNPTDTTKTTTPGGGTTAPKKTDVYICGTDNQKPCYWKNDTEVLLPFTGALGATATSIVVNGTDVYVSGYVGYGYKAGPCYWKNGVLVSLLLRTTSGIPGVGGYYATGIAFSDTNLYVATHQYWDTTIYTDDHYFKVDPAGSITEYGIGDEGGAAIINGICVTGTDVYLAGAGSKPEGMSGNRVQLDAFPSYYKNPGSNGGEHFLPNHLPLPINQNFWIGEATGIQVSGSDVYVCGWINTGQTNLTTVEQYLNPMAAYWKNDSLQVLDIPGGTGSAGMAYSIFLSGSDVYIAGYLGTSESSATAGYWKNEQFITLSNVSAFANSISVAPNGDVYVAGQTGDFNNGSAVYWKNGTMTVLAPGGGFTSANSVFLYTH